MFSVLKGFRDDPERDLSVLKEPTVCPYSYIDKVKICGKLFDGQHCGSEGPEKGVSMGKRFGLHAREGLPRWPCDSNDPKGGFPGCSYYAWAVFEARKAVAETLLRELLQKCLERGVPLQEIFDSVLKGAGLFGPFVAEDLSSDHSLGSELPPEAKD